MISFRVSGNEFEILKALHPSQGARSLSDFARTAMLRHLNNAEPSPAAAQHDALAAVGDLAGRIDQLQQDVIRLTNLVSSSLLDRAEQNPHHLKSLHAVANI